MPDAWGAHAPAIGHARDRYANKETNTETDAASNHGHAHDTPDLQSDSCAHCVALSASHQHSDGASIGCSDHAALSDPVCSALVEAIRSALAQPQRGPDLVHAHRPPERM